MLLRDLRKVASECCFDPKKATRSQKIMVEVGNPTYWTTKAAESIFTAQGLALGSDAYSKCVRDAITLLILSEAHIQDAKDKKPKKTRKHTPRQDSKAVKDT